MKTDNILLVVNGNYQEDISFINDYTAFEFNRVELAYISHFSALHVLVRGNCLWETLRSLLPVLWLFPWH